jgi:hypothetical protein
MLFIVDVTAPVMGSPLGQVVLLDGNVQLGPVLALSGGRAQYSTQLRVGQHDIRALYLGDLGASMNGSVSTELTLPISARPKPR